MSARTQTNAKPMLFKITLTLGEVIGIARRRCGMTITEVGAKSGISLDVVEQVERDQIDTDLATLTAICQAIGMDIHFEVGKANDAA